MPRYARLHAPGAVVHLIARFVNRQFRLAGQEERSAYLEKLAASLQRTDWRLLGYALMSSHVHLALLAGHQAPWRLVQPLHVAVARWLNRRQGALGPVFAERATMLWVPLERLAALLAYLHNNPVRAGLVRTAAASSWTSHRAYLGLGAPPPPLDPAWGLRLAGFASSAEGRRCFDTFVAAQAGSTSARMMRGPDLPGLRAGIRLACGAPVELTSPRLGPSGPLVQLVVPRATAVPLRPRWDGAMADVLEAVSEVRGVPVAAMQRRCKVPAVVAARRLAIVVATDGLGRRLNEVAAVLGLSSSTASVLRRGSVPQDEVRRIVGLLREDSSTRKPRPSSVP